jgi:hypothetical protein
LIDFRVVKPGEDRTVRHSLADHMCGMPAAAALFLVITVADRSLGRLTPREDPS